MEKHILEVLREIKAYIKYLTFHFKLDIALCGFYGNIPIELSDYLSEFMIHPNPYCQKMKATCMKSCLRQHVLVKKKALRCEQPFFGACYAGVYEYIVPIMEKNVYYGFISVTGYLAPKPHSALTNYKINNQQAYKKFLKAEIPSEDFLKTLLAPLKNSLKLLTYYYDANVIETQKKEDCLYQSILQYVSENYLLPLTMTVIAEDLHYSASYLSHIFKERNKQSIMQYVHQLKIKKAKDFLRSTDKSIMEISELLGFQDSNYFTSVFKKSTGMSPRAFRAEQRRSAYPPIMPSET